MTPLVSVIVCTLAEAQRKASLLRALDSARTASAQPVHIIAVVNGQRRDPEVVEALQAMEDVTLASLLQASLPAARLAGRQAVTTPFYCCLDDDDELLPGSIDVRLALLLGDPAVDIAVGNGYVRRNGSDTVFYRHLDQVTAAPLHALFKENWLASCGAMFRADSVGSGYFDDPLPYAEWTWLAFRLARDSKTVAVTDQPTFRIHDTAGSASKTPQYGDALETLHQKMLDSAPPADVARLVHQRISAHLHMKAEQLWRSGQLRQAWAVHLRSLSHPGGLRYLAFSRHLLLTRPADPGAAR